MSLSFVINQLTTKVHWLRCVEEMRNVSLVCHKSASHKGGLAEMCEKDEECFFHMS
jgi:hypothetical protein